MKIKNYILVVVLVVGFTGIQAAAQRVRSKHRAHRPNVAAQSGLTAAEVAAALDTSIETTCAQKAPATPKILSHNPQTFSAQRLANTLNGIWLGRVSGEYDPQLFAKDGFLNVDYFIIVDMKRGQAFTYQEFTNRRSGAAFTMSPGAPQWTYTWCAREDYQTKSPRQIHSFTKVSDDVDDAKDIIANAFGIQIPKNDKVVLADLWKTLVAQKFFDDPNRSLAYAGVLFNPVTMGTVASAGGGSLLEFRMVGEYRGIGETAAKFVPGEPIHNVEMGHFLGLTAGTATKGKATNKPATTELAGDFLVASVGLGNDAEQPKADAVVAVFSTQMSFDKVVIGPLQKGGLNSIAAAKADPDVKAPASNSSGSKQRRAHSSHR
jgi:hypothetical protein